jgi:hypothetical protein
MLFGKDIRERLRRVEKLLGDENRRALFLVSSEKRVKDLEDQNRQLFDRLMARDFQEFSVFEKDPEDLKVPDRELDETEDEESAGEILEITDE